MENDDHEAFVAMMREQGYSDHDISDLTDAISDDIDQSDDHFA